MIDPATKNHIDNMTYEQMLCLHRFAPVGHAYFIGEVGEYFQKVKAAKRDELKPGEHAAMSKQIGWEK